MSQHVERISFFLFLAAVSVLFATLLFPFFTAILWAVVFSVVFYPFSEWLTRITNGKRLLSVLVTLFCVFAVVVIILFGLGSLLFEDAVSLYVSLSSGDATRYLDMIEGNRYVQQGLTLAGVGEGEFRTKVIEIGQQGSGWLATQAFSVGANAAQFVLGLFIMLYLTFVFLRNGNEITERVIDTVPLDRAKTIYLFDRFVRTVQALFRGTLIVALAQGAVGGILFWFAGVPNPILWASIMALFALVPAVGPGVIWVPTALFLFLTGSTSGAVTVIIGGVLLVGLLDNLLRPILIGRDLEMSDALVMLSIISGLMAFGASGLVIGPVIAAIFLAGWGLFEKDYRAR